MADSIYDLELSGFSLPSTNPAFFRKRRYKEGADDPAHENRYDFHTLFYDCFFDPASGQVILACPTLLNFKKLIEAATFSLDGVISKPVKIEDKSRCSLVYFQSPVSAPQCLSIKHQGFGGNIAVGKSFLNEFKGLNALYAISQNNKLEWIQDWLRYNVVNHGANAVVLADNLSTDYSPSELRQAIDEVEGIKCAVIIRARFPFGPTDEAYNNVLYLQRSLAELYRIRFLGTARAVVNTDIDELFYSTSGQSIFDATAESDAGYIRANAQWVYAASDADPALMRHRDHGYVSRSGKPKANRKYALSPLGSQKGRQWLTHFLGNRKDPVSPDFILWHFRQVSTSWKNDRALNEIELEPLPELQKIMSQTFPKVP